MEDDLTPEYKEERDTLLKLIKSKLKPKVKNGISLYFCLTTLSLFLSLFVGRAITGPELASLLEILVAAANEGSLAEVCGGVC